MAVENIIESWKEVRSGLIDEAAQIPASQFSFQAAAGTRFSGADPATSYRVSEGFYR